MILSPNPAAAGAAQASANKTPTKNKGELSPPPLKNADFYTIVSFDTCSLCLCTENGQLLIKRLEISAATLKNANNDEIGLSSYL